MLATYCCEELVAGVVAMIPWLLIEEKVKVEEIANQFISVWPR